MKIILALLLFYLFCFIDKYITRKGIRPDASNEANFISRHAYKHLPRWFQTILEIIYILVVTYLAFILPPFYGLWLVYTFAIGHIIGFLSWTRFNKWRGKDMNWNIAFTLVAIISVVLGCILALIS